MSGQSDTEGRRSLGSRRLGWLECGVTISETAVVGDKKLEVSFFATNTSRAMQLREARGWGTIPATLRKQDP
jgi:hypothetical protein